MAKPKLNKRSETKFDRNLEQVIYSKENFQSEDFPVKSFDLKKETYVSIIPEEEHQRAKTVVDRFIRRYDNSYRLLAWHAALPLLLTPELLNYLRNRFLKGQVAWVAEVDLLLSELCEPVGYELYAMDTAVRAYLIHEFSQDSYFNSEHRMQDIAYLLIRYIHYLSRSNPFVGQAELQAQQWAAMAYLEDQKSTVVHDIAKSFQNAIPTMVGVEITGHTIDRYELKRLSDITLSLAPSLGAYSELIEYARNVSKLLHDPTGEYTEDLRRAGALDQVYIVNGEELPLLRKVSRSDISSTIPNENLDNNVMWHLPSIGDMLINRERKAEDDEYIRSQGRMIQETLALFGIPADFEGAYQGAVVTQYLIKPGYVERKVKGEVKQIKVKVAKIAGLANDLALALAAPSVRIEAPVPGTSCVGVEVANQQLNIVSLKELMESDVFQQSKGRLRIVLGEDVKGQAVISDMTRMPHLLIAGATGSGKSVCINSIISCLLLTVTPERLHLLMIDPQNMGLSIYNGIPHLRNSVITEIDKGVSAIFGVVREMERRYSQCSKVGARDLVRYNEYLSKRNEQILPHIVVIINELADLMMAFPDEAEKYICRLAQMGRAVGIHLIISTQRTSVDVITGLIKASFPARIAFAVTSQIDSRVILDIPGAERLLGRGDMLFFPPDANRLERLQGAFIDDEEINRIVYYWKTYSAA